MNGPIASVAAAPVAERAGESDRLLEASRQMEGVFFQYFTRALRATVPDGGNADAPGAELYGSLLDEHLARMLAEKSGSGLAEALYRQLSCNVWNPSQRGGE